MTRTKLILITLSILVTLPIIYIAIWVAIVDVEIREKFGAQGLVHPTTYYSAAPRLTPGDTFNEKRWVQVLEEQDYRKKEWGSILRRSDYAQATGTECTKIYEKALKCFAFYHHVDKKIYLIATDELDSVLLLLATDPETNQSSPTESVELFSQILAQYLGDAPIIQRRLPLNHIPLSCLDAPLAIEDPDFLHHQGVSFRGLARAIFVNLKSLRLSQGGSTITQQLVKNYFLNSERTFSRKIKEMLMAFVVEARIPKDQILETYLNIIYLGQQGSYQVRGVGAAAKFYFAKPAEHLDLAECALLGAVINSPGRYNPFAHPERALARREKVLKNMLEQNRILENDFKKAMAAPLPKKSTIEIKETAPYFIEGAKRELAKNGFSDLTGYSIYTTMNPWHQEAAQRSVQTQLNELEATSEYHKKNKAHSLQGILLANNPKTGEVLAVVGGRDHRKSQFNRVFDSARQVGSVFKPIVYLTAFMENKDFSPLTQIENTPLTHTYGKQSWSPHNYDNTTSDKVPAFYALKESLNIPTARLALQVGLPAVIDVAHRLGVESKLQEYPSVSLGAFEMKPLEVLTVYNTFARFGEKPDLYMVRRLENSEGQSLYQHHPPDWKDQVGTKEDFILLDSILADVMNTGTGRGARSVGFQGECAGKTGTTSDYKDAWFAGFTANQVAVVWVGYDDNTPLKLSGSSGALPIWAHYMTSVYKNTIVPPLPWPVDMNVENIEVSTRELIEAGVPEDKATNTRIYIRKN
ncbi:MAG: transglycosylase domain-containing protein [Bdellovibrionaceae bacterium]|nr:transglycosylase domain-containing protein [Pseudobdellovibrionaceae bacterium]